MVNLTIRLPDDLHRRLKELAKRNNRSLNGEIVHFLQEAVAEREKQDQQGKAR